MGDKTILVTGAAGFVGRHMLAALRRTWPRARLIAAIRPEDINGLIPASCDARVEFDLCREETIVGSVRAHRPDMCVHLAAQADIAQSFTDPDATWRANVDGTRVLAEAILRDAPGCVLLHVSSAEIYGLSFQHGNALDEEAPIRPANPYASAKAAIDIALGEMSLRGLRVLRMRPLNHIGPGQSARFAIAAFARQIALIEAGRQEPVMHTGALDRARDFLDVRDVCAAYIAALRDADTLPADAVFNIASGTPRNIGDILAELLALSPADITVRTAPSALRALDLVSTCCKGDRARQLLGFVPTISWQQTLADILADWRGRVAQGHAI